MLMVSATMMLLIGCEQMAGIGNDYCTLDSYITAYSSNSSEQLREILIHNQTLKEVCE